MSYLDRGKEIAEKKKLIKHWGRRIDKTGSRTKFCERHGFSKSMLSKYINFKVEPQWSTINRLEEALKTDGA